MLYVFKGARGKPMSYRDPDITEFWFCGYDDRGNLFADGSDYHRLRPFELAKLRNGGGNLTTISVDRKLGGPGGYSGTERASMLEMIRARLR